MKRNPVDLLVVALMFFILPACSKEGETESYLKGKIDGVPFECTRDFWATKKELGNNSITLLGENNQYSFRLILDGLGSGITEGTYVFGDGKTGNAVVWDVNEPYSAGYFPCILTPPCTYRGSGKITVLQINNKRVKGSFEFVSGVNGSTGLVKTITEGEFDIAR